tara:strand:+ start:235 stop:447 length:213 start_codon:yes stop_codon:yes gene_type:complete
MKVLTEEEFNKLDYDKKKIISSAIAKKMIQVFDEDELHFHLVMGLISEYNHEGWGYDKYEEDMRWFNDAN